MPTPYYKNLLQTLQTGGEISQLQYDIQNAPPAMKVISTNLFNVATCLLYHCVALTEELVRLNVLQRAQPAPPQVAPTPATQPARQTISPFPPTPTISLPQLSTPSLSSNTSPGDLTPCDVPQVVITPTGTRVIPPAGAGSAPVMLPPNAPVNLEQVQGRAVPPPATDGPAQVTLPRGGALPPDVQTALDARQGGTP
jgi:hypothetical protein